VNLVAAVAAVLLGVVFLVAGASKLAAGQGWREAARLLGSPTWLAPIVPWLELAVGALLIVQLWRTVVALVALAMLVVFTIAIAVKMRDQRRPSCACFGAWSESEIGVGHLVRNAILMILALLAALA